MYQHWLALSPIVVLKPVHNTCKFQTRRAAMCRVEVYSNANRTWPTERHVTTSVHSWAGVCCLGALTALVSVHNATAAGLRWSVHTHTHTLRKCNQSPPANELRNVTNCQYPPFLSISLSSTGLYTHTHTLRKCNQPPPANELRNVTKLSVPTLP